MASASHVVLDGFNNQVIGFALPAMLKDWGSQGAEFAPVVSGGLVVMAVGTFLGGLGGDRWGRKPSLIVSVLLFGAATAVTGVARTPVDVGVLRFLSSLHPEFQRIEHQSSSRSTAM